MNARHPMGVLHSFSIKNIFYDKSNLRLFYFHVTKYDYLCKSILSHMVFKLTYLLEQPILLVLYFPFCCSLFQIFPVSVRPSPSHLIKMKSCAYFRGSQLEIQ